MGVISYRIEFAPVGANSFLSDDTHFGRNLLFKEAIRRSQNLFPFENMAENMELYPLIFMLTGIEQRQEIRHIPICYMLYATQRITRWTTDPGVVRLILRFSGLSDETLH